MEAIIFTGIQAAGKSTFYRERFFDTHIRINLDMLRTRNRERILIAACLEGKQPFVVDNTNPTIEERAGYIAAARGSGFAVTGYYFLSSSGAAVARNQARDERWRVPDRAIFGTRKRLQPPSLREGFGRLYSVEIDDHGSFNVRELHDEI